MRFFEGKVKATVLASMAAIVMFAGGTAHAADRTWTGAVSTNWFDAGNWTPAGSPGAADKAIIGANYTVDVSSPLPIVVEVDTLVVGAGSTLTGNNTVEAAIRISLTDATIGGTGDIALEAGGELVFDSGSVTANSTTSRSLGARSTTGNNGNVILKKLKNAGKVKIVKGKVSFGDDIENLSGGTFSVLQDVNLEPIAGKSPKFYNKPGAKFSKTATATGGSGTTIVNMPFNNEGQVVIEDGTVNLAMGGTQQGSFEVQVGSILNMNGGELEAKDNTKFIGAGNSRIVGATLKLSGDVVIGATAGDGNLELASGGTLLGGGGTLNSAGAGSLKWSGGKMKSTVKLGAQHKLKIVDGAPKRLEGPIENSGSVEWIGTESVVGTKDAVVENLNSGTIELRGDVQLPPDATVVNASDFPKFINAGLVKKTEGTGTSTLSVRFENSGAVIVESGTLDVGPAFIQEVGSTSLNGGNLRTSGLIRIETGILDGTGTITGNVINVEGSLKPGHSPGSIIINGNYTQTTDGTLDMEIAGLNPGTQYDQMIVNGTATLAGTLNLTMLNGYLPKAGDNFQLLTYYASVGQFASVSGLYPGNQCYLTPVVTPSYYIASVIGDTALPTVTVTTPTLNAIYTSFSNVTGTATDSGAGLEAVTVRLYRYANAVNPAGFWNGTSWDTTYNAALHELAATGTSAWSFRLPSLDGRYYVRATAKDKAGNSATSAAIVFWVDDTAPSASTLSTPLGGYANSLPLISGEVSDDNAGVGIDRVELTIQRMSDLKFWADTSWVTLSKLLKADKTNINTLKAKWTRENSSATPLPTGSNLKDGSYTLTSTAYDLAGNKKDTKFTIVVDNVLPSLSVSTPGNNKNYPRTGLTALTAATGNVSDLNWLA